MRNKVFKHKVKAGAYEAMSGLMQYSGQVDWRMNEQVCRITQIRSVEMDLYDHLHKKYKDDQLWQIEVLGVEDREFVILESLLEELPAEDYVIVPV